MDSKASLPGSLSLRSAEAAVSTASDGGSDMPDQSVVKRLARDDVERKKFLRMAGKTMGAGVAASGLAALMLVIGPLLFRAGVGSKAGRGVRSPRPADLVTGIRPGVRAWLRPAVARVANEIEVRPDDGGGHASSASSTSISTRSRAKNPPRPPERMRSADTTLAPAPTLARARARAASRSRPSNRCVDKGHYPHGLDGQLGPDLRVGQDRYLRDGRPGEAADGGAQRGGADEHR